MNLKRNSFLPLALLGSLACNYSPQNKELFLDGVDYKKSKTYRDQIPGYNVEVNIYVDRNGKYIGRDVTLRAIDPVSARPYILTGIDRIGDHSIDMISVRETNFDTCSISDSLPKVFPVCETDRAKHAIELIELAEKTVKVPDIK